jgi:NAD(P)H-hydrate epimerase
MNVDIIDERPTLPPRDRTAHKGDFGRVLVVGGSRGMIGAPALAARAALRGGAGLVTLAVPETVQLAIASLCPCATSVPLACAAGGGLAAKSLRQLRAAAETADLLAVGPGLGVGGPQQQVVRMFLEQPRPVVLDADGLNNLATIDDWPARRQCPLLLTPHPGEFSRLARRGVDEIQSNREAVAVELTQAWLQPLAASHKKALAPLVLLLKGAGTVVTDGRRMCVNASGNPGLATGGSGDVLTGLIAALAAQGLDLFEAAYLGAHLHGRAGDLAAEQLTETALIATDLLDFLPDALKEITE